MTYVQFTEFRNNSKEYFDKVEHGDSFVIIRKGKPIAMLEPFSPRVEQGWKRDIVKVKLRGGRSSADVVREERDER
jgi:prevent-host-death family protein